MLEITYDRSVEPTRLRLTGSLTIYEVGEAHTNLLSMLATPEARPCLLDLEALEELDTAGAQLLLATQRHFEASGGSLKVHGPTPPVVEVIELLRLKSLYPDVLLAHR
jgi:anti-anti-sigma factor